MRLLTILLFLPLFSQSQIFFHETVENSNFPVFNFNAAPPATWSGTSQARANSTLTRTTEFARKGLYSCKITLTNAFSNDLFQLKRELNWNYLPAGAFVPAFNVDNRNRPAIGYKWTAVSTLIPTYNNDFNTITSIAFNTKEVNDDYPTTSYLAMDQGRYYLIVTPVFSNNTHGTPIKLDVGAVVKNQWEDWILERNFTNLDSGYVRLYKNGVLAASRTGGNWKMDAGRSKEAYQNMGVYKWAYSPNHNPVPNASTVTVFYDEYKFAGYGTTFQQMLVDPPAPPVNNKPTQSIATPAASQNTTQSVTTVAQDSDGTIASYRWRQVSGPSTATLLNITTPTVTIANMQVGSYILSSTVKDNLGDSNVANVTVTRLPATPLNVSANSNGFFRAPTSVISVVFISGGVQPYTINWSTVMAPEGTTPIISGSNNDTATITGLVPGEYSFQAEVTDAVGQTSFATYGFYVRPQAVLRVRFRSGKSVIKVPN